jgi:undecaprenyl-diphosphatase
MTIFDAIILGIVEGITEFLPISSTGHLILTNSLLGIAETDFVKTFEIAIQTGAIAAVLAMYWRKFLDWKTFTKVMTGFIPTAIIGLVLYQFVKTYLLGNTTVVVWALGIGGIALIAFEYFHREKEDASATIDAISYKQAATLGLFQAIAIIPGVSRSAATIVGGLMLGLTRITIVEFSFLLAVPTLGAATALDLFKSAHTFTAESLGLLAVGFVVSFIIALLSIRFLLSYVRTHTFIPFGIYRIIVAVLFFVFFLQ